jgi:hypothetical protein
MGRRTKRVPQDNNGVAGPKSSGLRDCLVLAADVSIICSHRDTFWKSQGNRKGVADDLTYNRPAMLRDKSADRADWSGRFVWANN